MFLEQISYPSFNFYSQLCYCTIIVISITCICTPVILLNWTFIVEGNCRAFVTHVYEYVLQTAVTGLIPRRHTCDYMWSVSEWPPGLCLPLAFSPMVIDFSFDVVCADSFCCDACVTLLRKITNFYVWFTNTWYTKQKALWLMKNMMVPHDENMLSLDSIKFCNKLHKYLLESSYWIHRSWIRFSSSYMFPSCEIIVHYWIKFSQIYFSVHMMGVGSQRMVLVNPWHSHIVALLCNFTTVLNPQKHQHKLFSIPK